jgi:hypothetical protein
MHDRNEQWERAGAPAVVSANARPLFTIAESRFVRGLPWRRPTKLRPTGVPTSHEKIASSSAKALTIRLTYWGWIILL